MPSRGPHEVRHLAREVPVVVVEGPVRQHLPEDRIGLRPARLTAVSEEHDVPDGLLVELEDLEDHLPHVEGLVIMTALHEEPIDREGLVDERQVLPLVPPPAPVADPLEVPEGREPWARALALALPHDVPALAPALPLEVLALALALALSFVRLPPPVGWEARWAIGCPEVRVITTRRAWRTCRCRLRTWRAWRRHHAGRRCSERWRWRHNVLSHPVPRDLIFWRLRHRDDLEDPYNTEEHEGPLSKPGCAQKA